MNQDQFTQQLQSEGFQEVLIVVREAGSMGEHSHPFEAKALVVEGELQICTSEFDRTYRVGDVFHLAAGVPHTEAYGPQGVKYLVGRKT